MLIALAVLARHPDARLLLLERESEPLGNHTWCFHQGDVPSSALALLEAAIAARWSAYDVCFPDHERRVAEQYSMLTSSSLRAVLARVLATSPNAALITEVSVTSTAAHTVKLQDGRTFEGRLVIDARGPGHMPAGRCGYQKFVGLEVETKTRTNLTCPVLMDARVEQTDGLRFFYLLPLSERRLLIEDTYFSDSSALDVPVITRAIEAYARDKGIEIAEVTRTERGVLPLPLRSPSFEPQSPFVAGYAGGFFHPTTGYSLPVALRLALHVAEHFDDPFGNRYAPLLRRHAARFRFAAFLNRLLFTAFEPQDRWHAMSRFYRLPVEVIRRFYALETGMADHVRIVCGRPPSGISVGTLLERGALA